MVSEIVAAIETTIAIVDCAKVECAEVAANCCMEEDERQKFAQRSDSAGDVSDWLKKNQPLLEAAPYMLAALEKLSAFACGKAGDLDQIREEACTAIAKARGEA